VQTNNSIILIRMQLKSPMNSNVCNDWHVSSHLWASEFRGKAPRKFTVSINEKCWNSIKWSNLLLV